MLARQHLGSRGRRSESAQASISGYQQIEPPDYHAHREVGIKHMALGMGTNWDTIAAQIDKTQSTTGGEALMNIGIVLSQLALALQIAEKRIQELERHEQARARLT
jgi:hypothetical protein